MGEKINKTKRKKNDKINHPSVSFVRVYVRYAKREKERENVHSNKQKAGQDARICRPTFFFFFLPVSWK
jgi:hypothetical protein